MPDTDFNIINSEIKTIFECISKKSLLEGTPLLLSKICIEENLFLLLNVILMVSSII